MRIILSRSVMMRGFIVGEFWDQRPKFLDEVSQWISEGKIRFREDIVEGLDNAPAAFMGLLEGRNFGTLVVKIDCRDRKSVVSGKSVSVRVTLGGGRIIKKK